MPRSGISGTYSLPPGTTPQQPNTTITSAVHNSAFDDVQQTFNTPTPEAYGGTNATTFQGALDNMFNGTNTVNAVRFPAVQVPSSNVNTLDDYEEGTWDPGFNVAVPGNVAITWAVRTGTYIKIGKRVFVDFQFQSTTFTHTTASGSVSITNLPFTADSTANVNAYGTLNWQGITKAGYTQWIAVVLAVVPAAINILGSGSGVASTGLQITDLPTSGAILLRGSVSYIAAN